MTDEELDQARIDEAGRRFHSASRTPSRTHTQILAALCREGWTPPPVIDPLLIETRQIMAKNHPLTAAAIVAGKWDSGPTMRFILAGIKRGIEIGRQEAGLG